MLIEAYPKKPNSGDLSLWIDEQQVKMYSGKYEHDKLDNYSLEALYELSSQVKDGDQFDVCL